MHDLTKPLTNYKPGEEVLVRGIVKEVRTTEVGQTLLVDVNDYEERVYINDPKQVFPSRGTLLLPDSGS